MATFVYPPTTIDNSGLLTPLNAIVTNTDRTADAVESLDTKTTAVDTGNVTVTSSVLPTGAATEATLQTLATEATLAGLAATDFATETTLATRASEATLSTLAATDFATETTLATLATEATVQTLATAAGQTTANASLSSIDGKITAVNTGAVVVASSALPSGAATEAKQDTGNTSLGSIDTKLSSQATAANQASTNTKLDTIATNQAAQATAANQAAEATLTGAVTETAPASDTASSGLNGRLQRIAQRLTSLIALLPASLGAKTSANSLAVVLASDQAVLSVTSNLGTYLAKGRNDYSSAAVTTAAYTQLIADTGSTAGREIEIFDSSGETLLIAIGAAASEVDKMYVMPGGNGRMPLTVPANSRVSVKAVTATASVGYININIYG